MTTLAELDRRDGALAILGMPRPVLLAFMEAMLIEKAYRAAAEQLHTEWKPHGHCAEVSIDLRDTLEHRWPKLGAVFVWGEFAYPMKAWPHAWVELDSLRHENGRCPVIDITVAQFLPPGEWDGESALVVMPDDKLADCYREQERDPSWAR